MEYFVAVKADQFIQAHVVVGIGGKYQVRYPHDRHSENYVKHEIGYCDLSAFSLDFIQILI